MQVFTQNLELNEMLLNSGSSSSQGLLSESNYSVIQNTLKKTIDLMHVASSYPRIVWPKEEFSRLSSKDFAFGGL